MCAEGRAAAVRVDMSNKHSFSNDIDDAIHMAVCQSINLDFDDIEEREAEVKQMLQKAIVKLLEDAQGLIPELKDDFETGYHAGVANYKEQILKHMRG